MAQQIGIEIVIDSQLTVSPFAYLTVNQKINDHHEFELRFNHDIKDGDDPITISKYYEYLGKSITITFGADLYDSASKHVDKTFKGIITEVMMSDSPYDVGSIIVKGKSASILLESREHCTLFLDADLRNIVNQIVNNAPSNLLSNSVQPDYKKPIPYIVQYKESNFSFLKRLAAEYGEWIVYDGVKFNFGKPNSIPVVELKYPVDVSGINLSLGVKPMATQKTGYTLKNDDDRFNAEASITGVTGLGNFGDKTLKASKDTFLFKSSSQASRNWKKDEVDDEVKLETGQIASDLIVLHADSDNPGVHVGTIVDISKNGSSMGKYFVIAALHKTDGHGNYMNSFKAIPADTKYLPVPEYEVPRIDNQIGQVIDNADPEGWGRVKVMLMWNSKDDKSRLPWIQVMTDYAGGDGREGKNRGIHFTPEIGDFVYVGFMENDPSQPFVYGSIPTQDVRNSSPNDKNFEKVITSRSGNTIFFRDKESSNEQEILIDTDGANLISILVSGGKGTIEIKSSQDINVTSDKTVHVKSEKITIEGKDIEMNANNTIDIKANNKVTIGAKEIAIDGQQKVAASAAQISISGSATTEVKAGAQLKLEASGQATLKGAVVMIN